MPTRNHTLMQVRLPLLRKPVGLGTLITHITRAAGVRPCTGCAKRAAALDKRVVFTPRGRV